MGYRTIISAEELENNLDNPDWVIVDCSFYLDDTDKGRLDYLADHIPGALYAHLDDDLSGPAVPGVTGRHPLPSVEAISDTLSKMGIDQHIQVIVYDARGGAIAAVRLWWMLHWLGHKNAAVLDGGLNTWLSAGRPTSSGFETASPREFFAAPNFQFIASVNEVDFARKNPLHSVIDARAEERFAGINEPIDPIAGHIPGALNSPYENILTAEGNFKPVVELRNIYSQLLQGKQPENSILYCGSGVTSIMHILAMEHIGMSGARLYVGSWSEWITDKNRPVAAN
jgi:thiosulfate/3-mercaptopyruvate sulfurtransferase